MCRIAGIIAKTNLSETREKVKLMCNALQQGGPDDEGIHQVDDITFGHRRLSIIDLTANGHQPMADIDQKAWLTYNGEIFNYKELKAELIAVGARFQSNSDTEVILLAYLHWGTGSFAKLNGMFAFALYDTVKQVTYLVRDSSGIKPLYYHIENNTLSFTSEIRALKAADITTQPNPDWQIKFLAYGHIPEPYTTLKNVFSLPKGHYICWDNNKQTHTTEKYYTTTPPANLITNTNDAREYIRGALTNAVNRQLMADAPLGVFLSGGIDSSIITLLANQQQKDLKTVSIFFDEKAYDERAYQNLVEDKITGVNFTHLVKQQDFDDSLPQIIDAMDMPTTDGINTWFISKFAHQDGLKAVLSGIGADELFGGYPSFNRIKRVEHLRMMPSILLNLARYFNADRYKKIAYLTHKHYLADYLLLRGIFPPDDIAQILNTDAKQVEDVLFRDANSWPVTAYDEQQASWFETNMYMQNQLLRDTDVMSMNHGLEVRVPFLDELFIQAAQHIAPEIRFDKHQPKKLLIDSFKDILPEAVWNRRKMGFSFPLQQWMKQHTEISNESLYKNSASKNIIKKFKNDQLHWSKAFTLYQLQKHG